MGRLTSGSSSAQQLRMSAQPLGALLRWQLADLAQLDALSGYFRGSLTCKQAWGLKGVFEKRV